MVWAKAGDHANRAKAANGRSVAVIRSPCPGRQSFAAGKLRIKIAFEACRRLGTFNHDQSLSCRFSPDAEKFAAPVRSNSAVDLIALEVHRIAGLVLGPYLDAWRLGEVIENLRGLALGELGPSGAAQRPIGGVRAAA